MIDNWVIPRTVLTFEDNFLQIITFARSTLMRRDVEARKKHSPPGLNSAIGWKFGQYAMNANLR